MVQWFGAWVGRWCFLLVSLAHTKGNKSGRGCVLHVLRVLGRQRVHRLLNEVGVLVLVCCRDFLVYKERRRKEAGRVFMLPWLLAGHPFFFVRKPHGFLRLAPTCRCLACVWVHGGSKRCVSRWSASVTCLRLFWGEGGCCSSVASVVCAVAIL